MGKAKNNLIKFFVGTILLSWTFWILSILINRNIISPGINKNILHIIGAFIPSLMGIYFIYIEDKESIINFLKKGIDYKFDLKYYL